MPPLDVIETGPLPSATRVTVGPPAAEANAGHATTAADAVSAANDPRRDLSTHRAYAQAAAFTSRGAGPLESHLSGGTGWSLNRTHYQRGAREPLAADPFGARLPTRRDGGPS